MSNDPPPPYPGGPSAPLIEEKNGQPAVTATAPVMTGPPQGPPLPPEYGPPPYEPSAHMGFVPPHVPGEGPPMPMPMPHPYVGQPTPGRYPAQPGRPTTVLSPLGATTMVTVLQGEMFQSAPVQTVCPHCQQTIITSISYEIGLLNTLFCLFCCFVGCDFGCCLLPCLINDLKDVTHTCPYCKGYIYTYKRMC
ncbi:cell death-inducing p53-target protein 1 isoform X2 [Brienomyrus brachyistius]|uniref:Cell death-inducing p53-target protein 1 n=2 Tax=Mormyridae TaxID=31092 RepID=A0A3B3QB27_9TELE|nr:cell death-inducing p53-target protein 1 [Paramormyrops kingsleyae]XP_023677810.1 cell death-inducing p53-target protein 1 [Paramormyrops kingsleyae]XP_048846808.1 cell death-inducing p53-target protein 1 isoform X2 [Brienomyrus brachyistius]XP_048846809.1 cell death-inducing p53-target protein 1 isoform X2 [Brienomyrus brachyistius]